MADEPPLSGEGISLKCSKLFFVHVILCPPQSVFQNSQFVSKWAPSAIYISLWCLYKFETIEACISVHIDLFLHIFCVGMFGIDCQWSDMAWQMNHPISDISVRWTLPRSLIWGQSDISIKCLSSSSFYKVFHNEKNVQCGINHMYTVVSQKCNICQLNSYST